MNFGGFTPCTLIDYPGKTACMVYTVGCNFRCPYCHNPELAEETVSDLVDESTVLSFLDTRQSMLDGVVITGGEPTMHGEDLLSFMEQVKKKKFLVKLDTNGTHPLLLETAIKDKLVDYIAMDIKAPLATYHVTTSRPVDTEAIQRSIDLLRDGKVPYEFRTTVTKPLLSASDMETIAGEIAGAAQYYLQKFNPTTVLNPQFKKQDEYTDEELGELQKIASRYVKRCDIR